jgi:predicted nucleic acid-binding protein
MYLVGQPHAHKVDAQRLLEQAIARGDKLVTDAEVLQEILHRYVAIRRRDAIQPAFDAVLGVVDEVLPIGVDESRRAKDIVLAYEGLSARDAVHLAVMERHGLTRVMSFDRGFDTFPGVSRMF